MNIARLCAAFAAALGLACIGPASAADALPDADQACLGCHGAKGLDKSFANGDKVALHVDAAGYGKSIHAPLGCTTCHAGVDPAKHPAAAKTFASARLFAIETAKACSTCHQDSFDAHANGLHGKIQLKNEGAPLCVTCHGTHDIVRASVSAAPREACLGCHANAPDAHDKWLPNTRKHFEVVACAACHAPSAGKRVELRFQDEATGREPVAKARPAAVKGKQPVLDTEAVRALVRAVDEAGGGRVVLAGRVEPAEGGEGHRLVAGDKAVKECSTCHRKGAEAFQNVSLSLLDESGARVRYDTQKDVLHALTSIESVRGFYAMGATRVHVLDVVLALALAGGVSAPLGHYLMRRIMRRKDGGK